MPSMTALATTAVPDHVRGALTRWMTEPAPGLCVGTLSARVRDELWSVVGASIGDGAAVLVHPEANEQGFALRTAGERRRIPVDFDGLTLVAFRPEEAERAREPADPEWRSAERSPLRRRGAVLLSEGSIRVVGTGEGPIGGKGRGRREG